MLTTRDFLLVYGGVLVAVAFGGRKAIEAWKVKRCGGGGDGVCGGMGRGADGLVRVSYCCNTTRFCCVVEACCSADRLIGWWSDWTIDSLGD